MKFIRSFFLTMACGAVLCGAAAEKTVRTFSPEDYEVAYRLLEVCGSRAEMRKNFEMMVELQIKDSANEAALRRAFMTFFDRYISFDAMKKEIAQVYLEEFTIAEIRAMTDFFASPAGKKFSEKQTAIAIAGGKLATKVMEKQIGHLQELIQKEVNGK